MTKKIKILIGIIILVLVILIFYFLSLRKEKSEYSLFKVSRGNVLHEISESGTVEKGEEINLNFKTNGNIETIFVKLGSEVTAGQQLVKLDTAQLNIQLVQAQANAQAQRARLAELLRGADTTLDGYYNDTPAILNQVYNLADNAIRQQIAVMFLYRVEASDPYFEITYKSCDSQAAFDSNNQRKIAEDELDTWRIELQNLSNSPEKLDEALVKAENHLKILQSFLNRLNDTLNLNCKLTHDEQTRINTNKPIVNLAITNLNTALTSVLNQKKAIDIQKLTVQNYTDNKEQINYQRALVNQAEAGVVLLEEQIKDATLQSPIDGQVVKINKKIGEYVLTTENVITLLPKNPFQVKVYIYEEDIVKVKIHDPVDIKLTAFPGQIFKGKVVSTDPASKLVDGIVYYGVTIDFEKPPLETRHGMTADITIVTDMRENVLSIPKSAIQEKEGKVFVQILKDKKIEEQQIQIGLKGSNDLVEVISGVQEGEEVILK